MSPRQTTSGVSIGMKQAFASLKNGKTLNEEPNTSEFTIKLANTLEERETAFNLAYRVYLHKGYIDKNSNKLLVNPYDFDDSTVILIVQDRFKSTVGSVTLVFDGLSKLPAENIYSAELRSLRKTGSRIAEMSRLVIDIAFRNSKEILVLLFNYAAIYIRLVENFNSLIIECNPRHKKFYLTLMKCDEVGQEKACPQVQNALAVLLHLTSEKYEMGLRNCTNIGLNNRLDKSLYPFYLKLGQEPLVALYLSKQKKSITLREKIYFSHSESGIEFAVSV
jgi:hypothetical protein